MIALPDKLLVLLREYYTVYKPQVFLLENLNGTQYSRQSVQLFLKATMKKVGIPSKGTHLSYATHLIKGDIRVLQELPGHNDIRTTMIYTHITNVDQKATPNPLDFS